MVDQIRFFATARPPSRGQERRRVHAQHDLDHPPRADRRVRPGGAVELPDDDGGLEVRPGDRRRQHRRAQAERHDARPPTLLLAEIAAEFLPPGVLNVICGDRDTGRAMVVHDTPAMVSVTGSVRAGMEVAAAAAQSLKRVPPRARRQGAGRRVRRRRHRRRRRGHRDRRLLQRRPGLHRGDPRARRAEASTTTSSPRSPSRRSGTKTGMPDDEDVLYGPVNNANQLARVDEHGRPRARPRLGGHRRRTPVGGDGLLLRADRRRRAATRTTR